METIAEPHLILEKGPYLQEVLWAERQVSTWWGAHDPVLWGHADLYSCDTAVNIVSLINLVTTAAGKGNI